MSKIPHAPIPYQRNILVTLAIAACVSVGFILGFVVRGA